MDIKLNEFIGGYEPLEHFKDGRRNYLEMEVWRMLERVQILIEIIPARFRIQEYLNHLGDFSHLTQWKRRDAGKNEHKEILILMFDGRRLSTSQFVACTFFVGFEATLLKKETGR